MAMEPESQLRAASRKCRWSCIIENRCYVAGKFLDDSVPTVNYLASDKYWNIHSCLDLTPEGVAWLVRSKEHFSSFNPIAGEWTNTPVRILSIRGVAKQIALRFKSRDTRRWSSSYPLRFIGRQWNLKWRWTCINFAAIVDQYCISMRMRFECFVHCKLYQQRGGSEII